MHLSLLLSARVGIFLMYVVLVRACDTLTLIFEIQSVYSTLVISWRSYCVLFSCELHKVTNFTRFAEYLGCSSLFVNVLCCLQEED